MEKIFGILNLIFGTIIFVLMLNEYLKVKKDRKYINSIIKYETEQTDDLRISSMSAVNVIVNFGSEFDYCKFYFKENEIYLFFRYSFPKDIYNGPFVIKKNDKNNYSYFSLFTISNFKIKENCLTIKFKNKTLIGSSYKLNIDNISEEDIELLSKILS